MAAARPGDAGRRLVVDRQAAAGSPLVVAHSAANAAGRASRAGPVVCYPSRTMRHGRVAAYRPMGGDCGRRAKWLYEQLRRHTSPGGVRPLAAYDEHGYGWVMFTGMLLLVLGTLNFIEGRRWPRSAISWARVVRIGRSRSPMVSVARRLSSAAPRTPMSSATRSGSASSHSAVSSTRFDTSGRLSGC